MVDLSAMQIRAETTLLFREISGKLLGQSGTDECLAWGNSAAQSLRNRDTHKKRSQVTYIISNFLVATLKKSK
jgi:hypothetical protein